MKTSKYIEQLYKIIEKSSSPAEARHFVSASMFNLLCELEEDGLEISEEAIEKKLKELVTDFKNASKEHVA